MKEKKVVYIVVRDTAYSKLIEGVFENTNDAFDLVDSFRPNNEEFRVERREVIA